MLTLEDRELLTVGLRLLGETDQTANAADYSCQRLQSDGSTRRFLRVCLPGDRKRIIVAPGSAGSLECAEARSGYHIGTHLRGKRLQIPEIYGWDEASGTLVYDDLGDIRLHDFWIDPANDQSEKEHLYGLAVKLLVDLQIDGAEGFDGSWCWDTSVYDEGVMLEKEAMYFYRAFWLDLLGQSAVPELENELIELVRQAAAIPRHFFLHRDFQSRNLMIHNDTIYAIDFQAGRFGPLGYDLASLLIDPYAALSGEMQDALFRNYLQLLGAKSPIDESRFILQYRRLSLQRNLQILGAFAFLTKVRGKNFFRHYIEPAARKLHDTLADQLFSDYPILRKTSTKILQLLGQNRVVL